MNIHYSYKIFFYSCISNKYTDSTENIKEGIERLSISKLTDLKKQGYTASYKLEDLDK